jgi:hypothetical protein
MGRKQVVLSVVAAGLMAGCSAAAEKEAERLSLACEFTRCDCVSNSLLILDSEPVIWQPDGSASCREGYHLRRLERGPSKPI